jgi:site-specific recombinase
LREETIRCRAELEYMHERMEEAGVSTALEFDIFTIERALQRLTCITDVLFSDGVDSYQVVKKLLDDVLRARIEDLSLSALVRENAGLLARKIVERTGKTGEHYIANTRNEILGNVDGGAGGRIADCWNGSHQIKNHDGRLAALFRRPVGGHGFRD